MILTEHRSESIYWNGSRAPFQHWISLDMFSGINWAVLPWSQAVFLVEFFWWSSLQTWLIFFLCHKNWQGVVKIECSPSNCYQVVCMRACIPSWCPCLVWMHIWSIFLFVFSLSLFVHLIFHISSACSVSMVLWHAVQMNMCAGLCVCMCSYIDTHRDTHAKIPVLYTPLFI